MVRLKLAIPLSVVAGLGFLVLQSSRQSFALSVAITFPDDEYRVTDLRRIRVAGHTDPEAEVYIRGVSTKVYPSGAFVAMVRLGEGDNRFEVAAFKENEEATAEIHVQQVPPLVTCSADRLTVEDRLTIPRGDAEVLEGTSLEVRIKGTRDCTAEVRLLPGGEWTPLEATTVEYRERVLGGIYRGEVPVEVPPGTTSATVEVRLANSAGKSAEFALPRPVSILSRGAPHVLRVQSQFANLYESPERNILLGMVPKGSLLLKTGSDSLNGTKYHRIALTPGGEVWVASSQLAPEPAGFPSERPKVAYPEISAGSDSTVLRFPLAYPVPVVSEQILGSATLALSFCDVDPESATGNWEINKGCLRALESRSYRSNTCNYLIELSQPYLWGYYLFYEGNTLVLEIRHPPVLDGGMDQPLRGLRVAVDPGHGGAHRGAIGPTALLEKTVNLDIAGILVDLLRADGAEVIMTRREDATVSLTDRVRIAREGRVHLLLSVHNNSAPAHEDPLEMRGGGTYYYHPQAMDLAEAVFQAHSTLGIAMDQVHRRNFALTRPFEMPAVLVESAFLSYPEEETLLADPEFRKRIAGCIHEGVTAFLQNRGLLEGAEGGP